MKNLSNHNVDMILKNTDALSGTPKILMRHAFALADQGMNVSVISENFHSNLTSSKQVKCLKTFKWPKTSLFQRRFFDWQARRKVQPGSLVIGHGDTLHQDILFLHTCAHRGAEVAPGPHNAKNLSLPFHRMIFEQGSFKEIVCVTNFMKNDIQKRFNVQVPMHVIYPGHDKDIVNQIDPAAVHELRGKLNVSGDEIVVAVICSGNLQNRGAFALLRGLSFLDQSQKNKIRVLIVGKESKPSKVYDLAQEVGMRDRVMWMNPRPDVANIISAADIVVHAANIEASGLTFLEFMALARPVIATATVGFSEILPDIQKEFVIERQDPLLIAQKLKHLLDDKERRQKMGGANQQVASKITWEAYDQQFLELIDNHIEKFRS